MPRFFWSMRCFLRLYVRNFWSHEKRLPPATLERLLMVLSSLYSARIEERFLSLATDLLLEMTSLSPDYTRNMFEFPLSECKFLVRFWYHFGVFLLPYFYRGFHHMLSVYSYHCRFFFFFVCNLQDYTIDSNWRLRSTVLTPMFMETQVTQAAGTQRANSPEIQPASMKGQIRATQASLEFSQTQAPGAGAFSLQFYPSV